MYQNVTTHHRLSQWLLANILYKNTRLFSYTKQYRLAGCISPSTVTSETSRSLQIFVLHSTLRKYTYECNINFTTTANILKVLMPIHVTVIILFYPIPYFSPASRIY